MDLSFQSFFVNRFSLEIENIGTAVFYNYILRDRRGNILNSRRTTFACKTKNLC